MSLLLFCLFAFFCTCCHFVSLWFFMFPVIHRRQRHRSRYDEFMQFRNSTHPQTECVNVSVTFVLCAAGGQFLSVSSFKVPEGGVASLSCQYSVKRFGLSRVCWGRGCGTFWCNNILVQTDENGVISKVQLSPLTPSASPLTLCLLTPSPSPLTLSQMFIDYNLAECLC